MMKILLVTEKCSKSDRDGGARLVSTLQKAFGSSLEVMQFGRPGDSNAQWQFEYPFKLHNRFESRIANAAFIMDKVKGVEAAFTHIFFVHISMQFGLVCLPLKKGIEIWTFPMFLTPSYVASNEKVPESYFRLEQSTLAQSKNIITPSYLEKRQLTKIYHIPEERIHVIPRGVDLELLEPKVRSAEGGLQFCSLGSIKPQKNTLGLVQLFCKIQTKFPKASLSIIGPIQNSGYFTQVCTEVEQLGLSKAVEFVGYVPPEKLFCALEGRHFHLSVSKCETFGRSIFETLASGIPNIARKADNAAADFLKHLPYARFVNNDDEALTEIEKILTNLPKLSVMAQEVGRLYDDRILSKLLVSRIRKSDTMAVSDFDGTLYHKNDPQKTQKSIDSFQRFSMRVICSARPLQDLIDQLRRYRLKVDWIIALSGSVIADGGGKILWTCPLNLEDIVRLKHLLPQGQVVEVEGKVHQIAVHARQRLDFFDFRTEIYQGMAFIAHWNASKLQAILWLVNHIDWQGQVCPFGDGPYDAEFLTYFGKAFANNEVIYV